MHEHPDRQVRHWRDPIMDIDGWLADLMDADPETRALMNMEIGELMRAAEVFTDPDPTPPHGMERPS